MKQDAALPKHRTRVLLVGDKITLPSAIANQYGIQQVEYMVLYDNVTWDLFPFAIIESTGNLFFFDKHEVYF
jgi:hypothetical protein